MAVVLAVLVLIFCIVKARNDDARTQRNLDSLRVKGLVDQGYRVDPDASAFKQASPEQLWREGAVCDYRYTAKDANGRDMEIFAMQGQQRVFGRYVGWDSGLEHGDIAIEGAWNGNGAVKAWDAAGNQFDVRITGKKETAGKP